MPTKVHRVQVMIFPVVKYGWESWAMKKIQCQRTDAFELQCWRILLRVPLSERRSNQSILKELTLNIHWKDWYWSWSSNTFTNWCEESTYLKRPWCLERLRAGGQVSQRGWDGWTASPTQQTWVWAHSRRYWRTGKPGMSTELQSWTWLSDQTTISEWIFGTDQQPHCTSWSSLSPLIQVTTLSLLHSSSNISPLWLPPSCSTDNFIWWFTEKNASLPIIPSTSLFLYEPFFL